MDTKELGNLGEKLACEYLVKKGLKILGRNDRINFGEIDIVARKKWKFFSRAARPIHFVEVKTILAANGDFFPDLFLRPRKSSDVRFGNTKVCL